MCQFKSAIVTKKSVLWHEDTDAHEVIIERSGLKDDGIRNNFVRVEMLPRDNDVFNHKLFNWYLQIDQDNIPEWFDKEKTEKRMKQIMMGKFQCRTQGKFQCRTQGKFQCRTLGKFQWIYSIFY